MALLLVGSKPLTYTTHKIKKEGRVKASRVRPYAFEHEYLVFHSPEPLESIAFLNKYLKGHAEGSYSSFIKTLQNENWEKDLLRDADSASSTSAYWVHYATDQFVSMSMDYDVVYPSIRDSHFGERILNYHVPSRAFLEVEDCFSFRKSPEAWVKHVKEREQINLDLDDAMPERFTLDESGVCFEFPRHGYVQHCFPWSIVRAYFVITACIPEELYLAGEAGSKEQVAVGAMWPSIEFSVQTTGVTAIAIGPISDTWAASCYGQTNLFRHDSLVKSIRMSQSFPLLAFSPEGDNLLGFETNGAIASGIVSQSAIDAALEGVWKIRNIVYSSSMDTAIVFVTPFRSKIATAKSSYAENGISSSLTILVMDRKTGKIIHKLQSDIGIAEYVPMAMFKDWVAIAHQHLQIWNWRTGAMVHKESQELPMKRFHLAFSKGGKQLFALANFGSSAFTWETKTWKCMWSGSIEVEAVTRVIAAPHAQELFAIGSENGAQLWKLTAAGQPLKVGTALPGPVTDLVFTKSGDRLYVAGGDSTRVYKLY